MTSDILIYRLDENNLINYVNETWENFAIANNCGHKCLSDYVLGMHYSNYIEGPETKLIYKYIIENVKKYRKKISFPFRCDSPGKRRYLKMEISLLGNGDLEFKSHTIKTEKRNNIKLLEQYIERSNTFLNICSMCKRVKTDKYIWVEIEKALKTLNLFSKTKLPQLTHGLCPECYRQMIDEINKIK